MMSENKDLFVIRATRDSAAIVNKTGFVPRTFIPFRDIMLVSKMSAAAIPKCRRQITNYQKYPTTTAVINSRIIAR